MARSQPPDWLWRFAWLSLATVLAVSIGGAVLLGLGAADPPRFGPLQWQIGNQEVWELAPGVDREQGINENFIVPAPPFTLEVTARWSAASDLSGRWMVILRSFPSITTAAPELIWVDGGGEYAKSEFVNGISFPHLRPIGQANLLRLDVDSSGMETLRFNDEIAWRGNYPPGSSATKLRLVALGGWQFNSRLTWERIALYAPAQPGVSGLSKRDIFGKIAVQF